LLTFLQDYLSDGRVVARSTHKEVVRSIYPGVTQGSVVYLLCVKHGLLHRRKDTKHLIVVAFANDLTLVLTKRKHDGIEVTFEEAIKVIIN
jgi:hypothetical protein